MIKLCDREKEMEAELRKVQQKKRNGKVRLKPLHYLHILYIYCGDYCHIRGKCMYSYHISSLRSSLCSSHYFVVFVFQGMANGEYVALNRDQWSPYFVPCPIQTCKYQSKGLGRHDHLQTHLGKLKA